MQVERRRKDRLEYTLPVVVQGAERGGKTYRFEAVARDIGAGGLCAFSPRMLRIGEKLSLHVRFAHPGSRTMQAPEASLRGFVVRAEKGPSGLCRFAVSFEARQHLSNLLLKC